MQRRWASRQPLQHKSSSYRSLLTEPPTALALGVACKVRQVQLLQKEAGSRCTLGVLQGGSCCRHSSTRALPEHRDMELTCRTSESCILFIGMRIDRGRGGYKYVMCSVVVYVYGKEQQRVKAAPAHVALAFRLSLVLPHLSGLYQPLQRRKPHRTLGPVVARQPHLDVGRRRNVPRIQCSTQLHPGI
jgi:hypothetical protein